MCLISGRSVGHIGYIYRIAVEAKDILLLCNRDEGYLYNERVRYRNLAEVDFVEAIRII